MLRLRAPRDRPLGFPEPEARRAELFRLLFLFEMLLGLTRCLAGLLGVSLFRMAFGLIHGAEGLIIMLLLGILPADFLGRFPIRPRLVLLDYVLFRFLRVLASLPGRTGLSALLGFFKVLGGFLSVLFLGEKLPGPSRRTE